MDRARVPFGERILNMSVRVGARAAASTGVSIFWAGMPGVMMNAGVITGIWRTGFWCEATGASSSTTLHPGARRIMTSPPCLGS